MPPTPPAHPASRPATPPARRLRMLHLEDSEPDHDLAMAHLARAGLATEVLRVDSEAAFRDALATDRKSVV